MNVGVLCTSTKLFLSISDYNAQAEYHCDNAMAIMNSSVTTTSGEREKADVFEILFRLNYIQGKAKMALKKLNEADTALLKVLNPLHIKSDFFLNLPLPPFFHPLSHYTGYTCRICCTKYRHDNFILLFQY